MEQTAENVALGNLLDLVEVCLPEGLFPPFASKITLPEERCQYVGALPVRTPGFFV